MGDPAWSRAVLALHLLAIDPKLGGIAIRARAGPVRDLLMARIPALPQPQHRLHPAISDEALYGGLNLAATLANGEVSHENGLLDQPGTLVLTMAERATVGLAAKLALTLDQGQGHCLVALDEGAEPDEMLNPKLAERLAFCVDLSEVRLQAAIPADVIDVAAAQQRLPLIKHDDDTMQRITGIAAQFGIDSMRAPLFTLRTARAIAALMDKNSIDDDILESACTLTLAHRATQMPATEEEDSEPPPPQDDTDEAPQKDKNETLDLPDELLLEAVKALLPDNLLEKLAAQKARSGKGSGTGAARKGNRRGRPLPSRAGKLGGGAKIDIISTLRAAAPWQTIRRQSSGRAGLQIRAADIRIKRFEEKSDRLLIFTVDASGSSALSRLAEAKGAVELLLAQAYARRDHVALIAFRGNEAELLLPPTRSLVQTKRRLAALPGGGGTPLAAGMVAALDQATQAARRGLTPTVAILTDGRANVALDGTGNRKQAAADALLIAKLLRANDTAGLVIDTGNRPEQGLITLAATLGATYLPMPRADAQRLSHSVSIALGD